MTPVPEFGLQLPVQAQSTLFAQTWERDAGPAELAAVAQACDQHGFDFVGVCDHVAIPRERAAAMSTVWYDPVATLGWLAGMTSRVKLLSHVYVVPFRHPLLTAKAFATLDAVSGGRVVLGVGVGHLAGEFAALDVPFAGRGARTDEYLRTIRAALADEWGAGDVGQRPRPVQAGGPPIWIGGSSPVALRRAARLGDGWLPQGPPADGIAAAITVLRRERAAAGRAGEPFAISAGVAGYVGAPGRSLPDEYTVGKPGRLAELVRDHVALGVTHIQVRIPSRDHVELIDQIAAWASEVIPLARS
jgi:probable F420-dependent oxidoreductase